MGQADFLKLGDWNANCAECGRKFKASTLIRHWKGYYVCKEHWETRHPQDFARGSSDNQAAPFVQELPIPTFVEGSPRSTIPSPSDYPIHGVD